MECFYMKCFHMKCFHGMFLYTMLPYEMADDEQAADVPHRSRGTRSILQGKRRPAGTERSVRVHEAGVRAGRGVRRHEEKAPSAIHLHGQRPAHLPPQTLRGQNRTRDAPVPQVMGRLRRDRPLQRPLRAHHPDSQSVPARR
mmetsp:Transcript_39161/g.58830  ORF Transcript_39161/g.58830 Transcript_39161/m.58830 type:complete len:142 (-) Transcript_39161:1184-1609(-)